MKKLILASTIAALSLTAAHAGTTVYGKAGVQLVYVDKDGESAELKLDDNSSRLGVKGGEKITANTSAVYQLEYALDSASGGLQFTPRDTFVGLENAALGTVKLGNLTSIDDAITLTNSPEAGGLSAYKGGKRWSNSVVYSTPAMNGMQVMAQYAVDDNEHTDESSFAVAGTYNVGPVSTGASYISSKSDADAVRLSASVAMSPVLKAGATYQMTDIDDKKTENALTVSANYDIANTPWDTYAQFSTTDNVGGMDKQSTTSITGGANYTFTKATYGTLWISTTESDTDSEDQLALGSAIVHAF